MFGFKSKRADAAPEPTAFERVQYSGERDLLEKLFEQYSLGGIIEHIHDSDQVSPFHQVILAEQLRLTPLLAPRVFEVFGDVCKRLAFEEPTDLFVFPRGEINAFALHRLEDDAPHVISVTSEVIKMMTDDEMRFTLGHEVGHLALRHYRVMMAQSILGRDDEEPGQQGQKSRVPQLLERRLDKWQRLAEISADRIGLVACDGDLSVAVASFFKMASGLGPEHLQFDLDGFLDQLTDLEKLDRREVMAQFSHPATPVRARALQLYAAAGGPDASRERLDEVDAEVARITGLMDFEVSTELGVHAREFLLAGGLLAAHSDGQIGDDEQDALTQLLLQVTGDPESHFERIKTSKQAEDMLDKACAWLCENAGQERYALFGQLCHVVAVDGTVTNEESAFMLRVARLLSIPDKAAREVMHDVLSGYVRTKNRSGAAAFGFGQG